MWGKASNCITTHIRCPWVDTHSWNPIGITFVLKNSERRVSKKGKVTHKQCRVSPPKSVSAFPQGKPSSQSTRGCLWGWELYTHTPQLGEDTRHMLDKKATMVLPLQRCAKPEENPVLLPWDESQTCSGHLDEELPTTPYSWSCVSRECRTRAACAPREAPTPAAGAAALSPLVPWLTATTPGQGWDCFFWG